MEKKSRRNPKLYPDVFEFLDGRHFFDVFLMTVECLIVTASSAQGSNSKKTLKDLESKLAVKKILTILEI